MNTLGLSVSSIKVTDQMLIETLLPHDGYKLRETNNGYFNVMAVGVVCATVTIQGGRIVFQFAEVGREGFWGNEFKKELLQKNPELDLDRIQYTVVFPWHGAYSFTGSPKATVPEALASISPTVFGTSGAYLVGFKVSEWKQQTLKVEHSFEIKGTSPTNFKVSDVDEGERMFVFTPLENFVKNKE